MKYIITIGILALALAGCESEQEREKRIAQFVQKRLAVVEAGGFSNPIQHTAGFYATKEGQIYDLSFADGTANLVSLEQVKKR